MTVSFAPIFHFETGQISRYTSTFKAKTGIKIALPKNVHLLMYRSLHNPYSMKRIQLFEFEDFHWLPTIIRVGITNLIAVLHRMMGTAEVVANLVTELKQKQQFDKIVDLGSGSGGPMPAVIQRLNEKSGVKPMQLLLTDLHPNPTLVQAVNNKQVEYVRYHPTAVDATHIRNAPEGLKTMIASFHHLPPTTAKQVLQSAQANKEAILIYELAKNNIPFIIWCLLLPVSLLILVLMSLVMTLFVRPLSISQLLFTYLIPIIPLVYAWDGQASIMRTYTFDDIETLIGEKTADYHWEIGEAKKENGKTLGYYVMGHPIK